MFFCCYQNPSASKETRNNIKDFLEHRDWSEVEVYTTKRHIFWLQTSFTQMEIVLISPSYAKLCVSENIAIIPWYICMDPVEEN